QAAEERRELLEAGLRGELAAIAVLPEDAEEAAHLAEGLAGGDPDVAQRGAGEVGVLVEGGLGGVRLDGDDADAVGDDVVQFAGDAGALLGDGGAGAALALVLEVDGQLLGAPLLFALPAGDAADQRGRQDGGHGAESLEDGVAVLGPADAGGDAAEDDRGD